MPQPTSWPSQSEQLLLCSCPLYYCLRHLNRPYCHSLHDSRPAFCLNWSQIVAINVGTLRSLSLNSRLFPVLPSFGSFGVFRHSPHCPGIIHGGALTCSLIWANVLSFCGHFQFEGGFPACAATCPPPPICRLATKQTNNHFPNLTTDNLLYALPCWQCQPSKVAALLDQAPKASACAAVC